MKWFLNLNSGDTNMRIYANNANKILSVFPMLGFSALEMIVVLGIVTLVASVILANYPGFNDRLAVRRTAEEIASGLRLAQAYGLGVKEFGTDQFPGYGIYFQIASPSSYTLFADINKNLVYDVSDESVKSNILQPNVVIYELCANQKQSPAGPCGLASLTISYTRPWPLISLKGGASPECRGVSGFWCDVEIKVRGSRGTTKTVIAWLTGQISVE